MSDVLTHNKFRFYRCSNTTLYMLTIMFKLYDINYAMFEVLVVIKLTTLNNHV